MIRHLTTALLALGLLALLTAPAFAQAVEGQDAPDFTLKDDHGKVRKLSDFRGKVVLLDVWATW